MTDIQLWLLFCDIGTSSLTSLSYLYEVISGKVDSDPLMSALGANHDYEVTISDSNIPFQGIPHITRSGILIHSQTQSESSDGR